MGPTLVFGPEQVDEIAAGVIRVVQPASFTLAKVSRQQIDCAHHLIGAVNDRPLLFTNHAALRETLLLTDACWDAIAGVLAVELLSSKTRGRCADGVARYVGFNRVWRPDCWRAVIDSAGYTVFPLGDLAHLWR